ncbi:MAG TPA: hypothetical protein VM389_10290 [Phycisphaerae bacterium]|nr:hypothetical protein [Phycisphaerae bacterium]HUU22911.1 hypothetical protein [Phycisphaerae bacterium]
MTDRPDPPRLRSADIISLLSPKPLWRLVRGMARAPFDEGFAGAPLAVCWFVNFACNARCPFCCKAGIIERSRLFGMMASGTES